MEKTDIGQQTERYLDDVKSPGNRDIIREYLVSLKGNGSKTATLGAYGNVLRRFSNAVKKPLDKVSAKDTQTYFANLEGAASTKELRKHTIKHFYKWRKGNGTKVPENVAWIRAKMVQKERQKEDMLTREEVATLIRAAQTDRNRAMIAALYESGMRASEFMSLRIRDVVPKEGWMEIVLPEGATSLKTGRRTIAIVDSVPYLQKWIERHPRGNDRDSPLWVSRQNPEKSMMRDSLLRIVKKAGRRGGLSKTISPHTFRHSRATETATRGWNESQMRKYFGWSRTSPMPSLYVHLADTDTRDQVLKDAGKKLPERKEAKENPLEPQTCTHCSNVNDATSIFCGKCSRPLSVEKVMELEKTMDELDREFEIVMEDPEIKALMKKKLREISSS